jgi:glutamyl-tRNA reductase
MDRIGLVGMDWRRGGPEALAPFTVPAEKRAAWIRDLASRTRIEEVVYLATCNRVEIAFVGDGRTPLARYRPLFFEVLAGRAPEPGEAERALRGWEGEGAAEHLFLVAAGLASSRVGEREIANQVRDAYDLSRDLGLTGARLDYLFEEALKVARKVHRSTALGCGKESLAEIALEHLRGRLEGDSGPVAVVGVSPMTERCARELACEGVRILVVNRTLERARVLARAVGGEARSLDDFRSSPDPVGALVSATGSPEPVLRRPELERLAARAPRGNPVLLVDMAVPPDVAPEDACASGVERVGMQEIVAEAERNRERRLVEAAEAREMVDRALLEFRRGLMNRVLSPLLAAVQVRYRQTALEGVERLFRKDLAGLGDSEREAVRRWAETLARRFAHLPTTGLREVAYASGSSAVEAFFARSDEKMRRILRETTGAPGTVRVSEGDEEGGA